MDQVKQPLGKVAFEAAEPVEKKQAKQPANRNLRKLVRDMVEKIMNTLFFVCGMVAILAVLLITGYMIVSGLPAIQQIGVVDFLFGTEWASTAAEPKFGILPFILTSVWGTLGAIVIGVPIGLLTAVFLSKVASPKVAGVVRPAVELLAGEKATAETGSPLPEETMNALRTADFAMKGPLGTPVGTGIRSLNVALRQTLDLYACIRPVRHFEGLETPVKHPERVNMVIFRENTEDVYAGIEYAAQTPEAKKLIAFLREEFGVTKIREEAAVGIKPMSEFGSKRLVRRALRFALDTGSKSLTLVHKGNIMKFTEGGFRQWGYDVAAQEFGDLTCTEKEPVEGRLVVKDRIADAMFQEALLRPEQYQILATPNLNGDYISDALAAQVGGLGLAPGVNMSDSLAFYEATHGTAPTIAGQDKANPGSVILCGALMLEQMGVPAAAERIRNAMSKAIAGRAVTVDLAAQVEGARVVGCQEFGEIIGACL